MIFASQHWPLLYKKNFHKENKINHIIHRFVQNLIIPLLLRTWRFYFLSINNFCVFYYNHWISPIGNNFFVWLNMCYILNFQKLTHRYPLPNMWRLFIMSEQTLYLINFCRQAFKLYIYPDLIILSFTTMEVLTLC